MSTEDQEAVLNVFGQFDIVDDSNEEDKVAKPAPFNDAKPGQLNLLGDWYLSPPSETKLIWDDLEILHKQAMYYSWKCQYREAIKVYKKILDSYSHKGSHRREILDAIVHLSLQGKFMESLESSFYALRNDVETYGDQLNLWSTTIMVAENSHGKHLVSPIEHISAIIYLCTLSECGRHWAMFSKVDSCFLSKNSNFGFGAKVRAFFLLKPEYGNFERAADSIERITEDLMMKLRKELLDNHSEEEIINSRNRVCGDIIKVPKASSEEIHQEPPPHACKLDSIVKTSEELDIIRRHFVSKFSFLFEDNQELSQMVCETKIPEVNQEKQWNWDEGLDSDREEQN